MKECRCWLPNEFGDCMEFHPDRHCPLHGEDAKGLPPGTPYAEIADLKVAKEEHDLQISRWLPPLTPHEKHCSSTEQLHRAIRVGPWSIIAVDNVLHIATLAVIARLLHW